MKVINKTVWDTKSLKNKKSKRLQGQLKKGLVRYFSLCRGKGYEKVLVAAGKIKKGGD